MVRTLIDELGAFSFSFSHLSADELRTWAAERVPEPAAAPKSVSILDPLPLTAMGKPNKVPLRAEAARDALSEALAGVEGVRRVDSSTDDGTMALVVTVDADADVGAIQQVLDRYTVAWRIKHAR